LFSKSGKNKQDTAGQDSGYYTSADDQAVMERARSKRASSADGPKRGRASKEVADDPMLPEKKRARRRLVGAIALALTVAIVLPMVLDSEPKPLASDIDIKIPSKDKPAEAAPAPAPAPQAAAPAAPAPAAAATVPAAATLDKSEEIVADPGKLALKPSPELTTPQTVKEAKPTKSEADLKAEAKAKADAKAEADAKLAKAKADAKAEAEAKAKLEAKAKSEAEHKEAKAAESKPAAANDDARALAILEGKPSDNQKYVLQVAALAAQDKVDELQEKLKEAGIKSFTQKVPTAQGERTRIRVGPFNSKEEAEKVRAKLTKLGLNGSLVPV